MRDCLRRMGKVAVHDYHDVAGGQLHSGKYRRAETQLIRPTDDSNMQFLIADVLGVLTCNVASAVR